MDTHTHKHAHGRIQNPHHISTPYFLTVMGTSSSINISAAYTHASSSLEAILVQFQSRMSLQLGDKNTAFNPIGGEAGCDVYGGNDKKERGSLHTSLPLVSYLLAILFFVLCYIFSSFQCQEQIYYFLNVGDYYFITVVDYYYFISFYSYTSVLAILYQFYAIFSFFQCQESVCWRLLLSHYFYSYTARFRVNYSEMTGNECQELYICK